MGEGNRPSSGTVAEHYERNDSIVEAIVAAIEGSGLDATDAANFAGAEEFHLGGRSTADALIADLALDAAGVHLDVGCGIGGTARRIAVSPPRWDVGSSVWISRLGSSRPLVS